MIKLIENVCVCGGGNADARTPIQAIGMRTLMIGSTMSKFTVSAVASETV